MPEPTVVIVVASGAGWESDVLARLGEHPHLVVLKRCVDVEDLLAAASAGQAHVAVLGLDAPGLDASAVDHLHHHGVRAVAIAAAHAVDAGRLHAERIGITTVLGEDDLGPLADAVAEPTAPPARGWPTGPPPPHPPAARGRVTTVWGPGGAPGRTTVAVAVAAELGRRGLRTVLVDADPYGGAVGQQLGILDEASGLLAATRLASTGGLGERFATVQRAVDQRVTVLTGLPRPDRWVEVRPGAVQRLLEVAGGHGQVVVDTGFSLEEEPALDHGARAGRNQLTLEALEVADDVVVVGTADPVGLSRLARGLVELAERFPDRVVRVAVNRMRPSLGWSEKDVAAMVSGFASPGTVHFLPEDQATVDRAVVAGRSLLEVGEGPLTRAVAALVDAMGPAGLRPRTAGTTRRR